MVSGVQVTNIRETQKLDNRNQVQRGILITYMVGQHGPFTEEATMDDFRSGAAQQRMELHASTVNRYAPGA